MDKDGDGRISSEEFVDALAPSNFLFTNPEALRVTAMREDLAATRARLSEALLELSPERVAYETGAALSGGGGGGSAGGTAPHRSTVCHRSTGTGHERG